MVASCHTFFLFVLQTSNKCNGVYVYLLRVFGSMNTHSNGERPMKNCAAHEVDAKEPIVIQLIRRPKAYINHTYRDFSTVPPTSGTSNQWYIFKSIEEMTLVEKIHHILSQNIYYQIIHWLPHGRAFLVEVPKRLEQEILPVYFGHRRYSSFLRQLSNHGFKCLTKGPDRNCQYHEVGSRFDYIV